jgi:hypothetical protein
MVVVSRPGSKVDEARLRDDTWAGGCVISQLSTIRPTPDDIPGVTQTAFPLSEHEFIAKTS